MRYVLILLGVMFANVASAIDCQTPPSCTELGYVTEDDPSCAANGYVYCPFDENYKKCVNYDCETLGFTKDDKTSWCEDIIYCASNHSYSLCKTIQLQCEIGDVFYADRTCGKAADYDQNDKIKIPVGVVYYVTDEGRHGKVINLHDLGRKSEASPFDPENPYEEISTWNGYMRNIPDLKDWTDSTLLEAVRTEDRNNEIWSAGKKNTDIIVKALENNLQYMAPAAKAFYPLGVNPNDSLVGQGKWYLPTMGELMDLYGHNYSAIKTIAGNSGATGVTKDKVNATLKALKDKRVIAEMLKGVHYCSSTESYRGSSYSLSLDIGSRNNDPKTIFYIRASLEF